MSTKTTQKTLLAASATVMGAVGYLIAPAPAQAVPMVPLAPACTQYGFNDTGFTITQSNGWQVFLNQTGKNEKTVQGRALTSDKDGANLAGGNIEKAYIDGNLVHIAILWDSGTSEGIYSGAVGDDGIARGQAVDGKNPGQQASWQSIRALPCITAAGPTPERPDRDGDGMLNEDEANGWNKGGFVTDPDNPDTDGDGVNDGAEDDNGTNPLDPNDP